MEKKRRFSPYFYNAITYTGVWLAVFFCVTEIFLFAVDFFAHGKNLYLGLFTYIALPPFLVLGLLLIPLGALRKRYLVRKGRVPLEPQPLRIDPSIPAHRNAIFVFIIGSSILALMTFVGAYKGFHYTESVEFCGVLCHKVMQAEYTAYRSSPHARVKCVECHIGSGADWYVRSKLSGTRQIFKAITNSYERPIPTPVKHLRPAPETCEQCHWPDKFYGTFDFKRRYYLTSGEDSPWHIRMLLNVGGGEKDQNYGVHAHMNVGHDVYYAAEDERRQEISWVKSVDKSGRETVFTAPKSKYRDTPPPAERVRKMDCIDCHNRPSHRFLPPYRLVNEAMRRGDVDPRIPQIKEEAVKVLSAEYKTRKEAFRAIRKSLYGYYRTNHPDFYRSGRPALKEAAAALLRLYKANMFPEAEARWDRFPDNIGHLTSPGCFRCHDGEHRSADGKVITRDCGACHTIVEQGPVGAVEKNIEGLPFRHPVDVDDAWKETHCTDCHTGGA
ncbi:MAG: NapC/NirT family cytochrome c [Candidatus Omnitrophica bacterium]|nr:NapC/NirT family cytochrome c [Candidatus Omnitrophota bacterium]